MRNHFPNAAAPNPMASSMKRTPTPVRIPCMLSVSVALTPRRCIGKNSVTTKPRTSFPISRCPDAHSECDHKDAIHEEKWNDEWFRRSVDSEQLADGLRGGAVALPSPRCEYDGGDIQHRGDNAAASKIF